MGSSMEHLAPGKRSSRLWIKRRCESDMFETISSTKGTRGNIQNEVEHLVLLGVLEISNYSE